MFSIVSVSVVRLVILTYPMYFSDKIKSVLTFSNSSSWYMLSKLINTKNLNKVGKALLYPLRGTTTFELSVHMYLCVTSCNPFNVAVQL